MRSPVSSLRRAEPGSAAQARAPVPTCCPERWAGDILSFPSLSDTESAEDQIEDVIVGGSAGDLVEGPKGIVEIKQ